MSGKSAVVLIALILLIVLTSAQVNVGIDRRRSLQWLATQQAPDGSFSLPTYQGTSIGAYSTFLAVSALANSKALGIINTERVRVFANSLNDNTDSLYAWLLLKELGALDNNTARIILNRTINYYFPSKDTINASRLEPWNAFLLAKVLTESGNVQESRLLRDWLTRKQNPDGSFGYDDKLTEGTARSTSWALMALKMLGANIQNLLLATHWLHYRQLSNGGEEEASNFGYASVSATAWALIALRDTEHLEAINLESALQFLSSNQLIDGSFEDFTTWRLGIRQGDGEATALALWATYDRATQVSSPTLWAISRIIHTYAYTSASFLVLLSVLTCALLGQTNKSRSIFRRLLSRYRGVIGDRHYRPSKRSIFAVLKSIGLPAMALIVSQPYVDLFLLAVFFVDFNLGRLHRLSRGLIILSSILPLIAYLVFQNSFATVSRYLEGLSVEQFRGPALLSSVAGNPATLLLLLTFAFSVVLSAVTLLVSTDWTRRDIPATQWFGQKSIRKANRLAFFWGTLRVEAITGKRLDVCIVESGAFYLLVLFFAGISGVHVPSWLPRESHPSYWYGLIMLCWTLYDIIVHGEIDSKSKVSLWRNAIGVFQNQWSMLYLLVMFFAITLALGFLSTMLGEYGLFSFFPRIFQAVDEVRLYGWISVSAKSEQQQIVLFDVTAVGSAILSLIYLCAYPLHRAYHLLRAEVNPRAIHVHSIGQVVVSVIAEYLSLLIFFNLYAIDWFAPLSSGLNLLRMELQLLLVGVAFGLFGIDVYLLTRGGIALRVGSTGRRLLALAIVGPVFCSSAYINPTLGALYVFSIVVGAAAWRYLLLRVKGAKPSRKRSASILATFFAASGIVAVSLGGYLIGLGMVALLLSVRHIAEALFGQKGRKRVEYLLGIYGVEIG